MKVNEVITKATSISSGKPDWRFIEDDPKSERKVSFFMIAVRVSGSTNCYLTIDGTLGGN